MLKPTMYTAYFSSESSTTTAKKSEAIRILLAAKHQRAMILVSVGLSAMATTDEKLERALADLPDEMLYMLVKVVAFAQIVLPNDKAHDLPRLRAKCMKRVKTLDRCDHKMLMAVLGSSDSARFIYHVIGKADAEKLCVLLEHCKALAKVEGK